MSKQPLSISDEAKVQMPMKTVASLIAMRTIEPERIQFKCGANIKARVEYIEEKGQTVARTRIIEVLDHGYESDSYEAESRY